MWPVYILGWLWAASRAPAASAAKKLRGLSARAQARRISTSPSRLVSIAANCYLFVANGQMDRAEMGSRPCLHGNGEMPRQFKRLRKKAKIEGKQSAHARGALANFDSKAPHYMLISGCTFRYGVLPETGRYGALELRSNVASCKFPPAGS